MPQKTYPLFPQGIQGLSNSKWSGVPGSAYRLVGVDYRSVPGIIQAHQALAKHSSTVITELCKSKVACSDGSNLWFSSESGKVWREVDGTYTLVYENAQSISMTTTMGAAVQTVHGVLFVRPDDPASAPSVVAQARNTAASGTSLTTSITVPAGASAVYVYHHNYTDTTSASATIGGDAMTSVGGAQCAGTPNVVTRVFRKLDPTPGTQDVVVSYGSSMDNLSTSVVVLDNVDQADPNSSMTWGSTPSTTQTLNRNVDKPNSLLLASLVSETTTHSPAADQTEIYNMTNTLGRDSLTSKVVEGANLKTSDAEEHDGYVFWAIFDKLYRIPVGNVGDTWSSYVTIHGTFAKGSDYHPMAIQNLQLFIGDKTVVAKIAEGGSFVDETEFFVKEPEEITALTPFDIDLLVGTRIGTQNKARVLRWDTENVSWMAEDDVMENGVNAFIPDDNFMYVQAGEFGRVFFYNGEIMVPFQQLPGSWSPTSRAKINRNAVATLFGVPRFGLSQVEGNPILQGVYSFGSYSKDYPKTLDLSFPISSGDFEDIEIGAVLARGADLLVSWKKGAATGVDKLSYTTKYNGAYIETMMLTGLAQRSVLKNLQEMFADYASLPANTSITFGVKKRHEASYTTQTSLTDTKLLQVRVKSSTVPDIASLQLKIAIGTNGNNSPLIENLAIK